jgi:hypothetical protein
MTYKLGTINMGSMGCGIRFDAITSSKDTMFVFQLGPGVATIDDAAAFVRMVKNIVAENDDEAQVKLADDEFMQDLVELAPADWTVRRILKFLSMIVAVFPK